jgi:hypothetical protein
MTAPALSIVIGAYNMRRELPRTIRSLSPGIQREIDGGDYEIIIVDNGSTRDFDEDRCRAWGADIRVLRTPAPAPVSPVAAVNAGIATARGALIGVMIDGARIASPGLLRWALRADRLFPRTIVATLGFHLGRRIQQESVRSGYDEAAEDLLLARSGWEEDGYRLFDISVFGASSRRGWFGPVPESNALFMRRALWDELGGFHPGFETPGGGFANLDLFSRAVALPDSNVVTLLGEGTFHQVHGGVTTGSTEDLNAAFHAEYLRVRGRRYDAPGYESVYLGTMPRTGSAALRSGGPGPHLLLGRIARGMGRRLAQARRIAFRLRRANPVP